MSETEQDTVEVCNVECPLCGQWIGSYSSNNQPIDAMLMADCPECGVNVVITGINHEYRWYMGANSLSSILHALIYWLIHRSDDDKSPF